MLLRCRLSALGVLSLQAAFACLQGHGHPLSYGLARQGGVTSVAMVASRLISDLVDRFLEVTQGVMASSGPELSEARRAEFTY